MSSREIQELQEMFNRIMQEESLSEMPKEDNLHGKTKKSSFMECERLTKDFRRLQSADSDEGLVEIFESLHVARKETPPAFMNKTPSDFAAIDGLPLIEKDTQVEFPLFRHGDLLPYPEGFLQELDNNEAIHKELFSHTPRQNMLEIMRHNYVYPTVYDFQVPRMDFQTLLDTALIETDQQIYRNDSLKHTMSLAFYENKTIKQLKEILKDVKKQPI